MTDPRDDITTRAASYAAGALTEAERRELEKELRRSPRLAAETAEFTETAALLGLAVEPVSPSPSARSKVLNAIENTPQESNVTRGSWFSRPVALLLGAAAIIVLAVGSTAVAINLLREPSAVEQITAAADYERVVHEMESGASVTAIWSDSLGRAALVIDDMAGPPAGHTYQAWLIDTAGHAAPDALFDPTGETVVSVPLIGAMHDGDAIGITIEPVGGSEMPTTEPILVISTT